MDVKKQVVKPSVWNLLERKIAPLWVNDDREDVILAKIQKEEAEERELAKARRKILSSLRSHSFFLCEQAGWSAQCRVCF